MYILNSPPHYQQLLFLDPLLESPCHYQEHLENSDSEESHFGNVGNYKSIDEIFKEEIQI